MTTLEAPRGFFQAAGGGFDPSLIDGVLGRPWTFASPGISIKPHPSGSLTHPAMATLLDLLQEQEVDSRQVASLVVGTNHHMPTALIHHRPRTALEAKFSMEFCLAILLLEGRASLREFTDEVVRRDDVQDLIERVQFQVDPEADAAGYQTLRSNLRLVLRNGTALTASADFGKGSPSNPMTDDELIAKFHDCASWAGLDPTSANEIVDRIFGLEHQETVHRLVAAAAFEPD